MNRNALLIILAGVLSIILLRSNAADTVIVGDSIARGCCATVGPEQYLSSLGPVRNLAIDGNQVAPTTALLGRIPDGRVFVHVGINDVWRDNPNAERDLDALLATIKARRGLLVALDELGPLRPYMVTPEREALRQRMNAKIRAFRAPNVVVVPFRATSLPDGMHPDAHGYAQQMPAVIAAFRTL